MFWVKIQCFSDCVFPKDEVYSGAGFWGCSTLFPVSLRVSLSGGPGAGRVTFSVGLKPTPLRFLLSEDPVQVVFRFPSG